MSEEGDHKGEIMGISYENKYKRSQSLNDSWNLGEQTDERVEIKLRKYESFNQ